MQLTVTATLPPAAVLRLPGFQQVVLLAMRKRELARISFFTAMLIALGVRRLLAIVALLTSH